MAFGLLDFELDFVDLFFDVGGAAGRGFFRFPDFVQIGVFFLQAIDFFVDQLQAFFAGVVAFFFHVHPLHFELDDAAVEFVHLLGFGIQLHFDAAGRFVNQINRFVGQKAVGDVAVAQFGGGDNRRVGDVDAVMDFVTLLQTAQNRNRVFHAGFAHQYFLETALQRGIFFDVLAVFVERGRADAVQLAARQRRFEHIARVHRAVGFARAHEGVDFVDENQRVAVVFGQVVQHGFKAFFKLAAIFRTGNQRGQIEYQQAFVAQAFGYFAVHNTLRQAFHNCGFAHARLADKHGVVFGTALQNLNRAADFVVAADYWVELAVAGALG